MFFSVMGRLLLEVGIDVPLFVCIIKSGEVQEFPNTGSAI